MDGTVFLFACGTLRKEFNPKPKVELKDLIFVCEGKVHRRLFDLGDDRGAVEGEGGIIGDVFEVKDSFTTFKNVEEYEGNEFVRKVVSVRTANGSEKRAWMYRFAGKASGRKQIADGDYLNYLKTKDSLR